MAYSNNEGSQGSAALTANKTGDTVESRGLAAGGFQVTWTGATANTAVFKLQKSMNGVDYEDTGLTQTLNGGAGTKLLEVTVACATYYRYVLTANGETTGTFTSYFYFRG